jgi:Na+/H+-dicarboxylate symporter
MGPLFWPEYQCFVGSILSVEVNTFFLIARRVAFKTSSPVPPFVQQFISTMFYVTWVWIRCYVYPYMFVVFVYMAIERVETTNQYIHVEMVFIVAHAVLCLLNAKWTYDLFKPIFERWLGTGPKTVTIQSGL